jgi:hypothetical protein
MSGNNLKIENFKIIRIRIPRYPHRPPLRFKPLDLQLYILNLVRVKTRPDACQQKVKKSIVKTEHETEVL